MMVMGIRVVHNGRCKCTVRLRQARERANAEFERRTPGNYSQRLSLNRDTRHILARASCDYRAARRGGALQWGEFVSRTSGTQRVTRFERHLRIGKRDTSRVPPQRAELGAAASDAYRPRLLSLLRRVALGTVTTRHLPLPMSREVNNHPTLSSTYRRVDGRTRIFNPFREGMWVRHSA